MPVLDEITVKFDVRRTRRFQALEWLTDRLTAARMHRAAGWLIGTVLPHVPVCYVRANGRGKWSPVYANIRKPVAPPQPPAPRDLFSDWLAWVENRRISH